ncbi:Hypothetical_protein [Hexamita inflata]|uniref:Hypothetical_protein n=1 Tax=Hexamita inflata TaxID=28002 RepID=A0AA86TLW3_9EUKA|nr:Hypothetical protein HINF_LOCUS7247 [Hexamita inflata]
MNLLRQTKFLFLGYVLWKFYIPDNSILVLQESKELAIRNVISYTTYHIQLAKSLPKSQPKKSYSDKQIMIVREKTSITRQIVRTNQFPSVFILISHLFMSYQFNQVQTQYYQFGHEQQCQKILIARQMQNVLLNLFKRMVILEQSKLALL